MSGRPKSWDIVRVAFPHADAPIAEGRPALVVASPAATDVFGIVWVLMVTSFRHNPWPDDVMVTDFAGAGLTRPSIIRTGKIASIDTRFARALGHLSESDRVNVTAGLRRHLGSALEQYHPDWNREANQGDEIARESWARAFPLRVETL